MSQQAYVKQLGEAARTAAKAIAAATTAQKNNALLAIAQALTDSRSALKAANQKDLDAAQDNGLEAALLDRLVLSDSQIDTMIEGLHQVASLADPVGEISNMNYRPSGIQVGRMRVPLGVIGIIYESRPNVTVEAASLCLKSGNAAILRGGSEALHSNQAVADCIRQGLEQAGLAATTVQVVETADRDVVAHMITAPEYIDVIVPRGGKGLIERISRDAKVTVIKHLDGVCHVYIDAAADLDKAFDIALNAKTQRYGTCNTMETLLINSAVASAILPKLLTAYRAKEVELRVCSRLAEYADVDDCIAATPEDWSAEYLAPVLALKIVDDLDQAIEHINRYSSQHTDAIVSEDFSAARRFLREVDSSSVMVNASTRFADGFEYGLGAEIGISTDKIHARGPVGLDGLTSLKYVVFGDGHVRV